IASNLSVAFRPTLAVSPRFSEDMAGSGFSPFRALPRRFRSGFLFMEVRYHSTEDNECPNHKHLECHQPDCSVGPPAHTRNRWQLLRRGNQLLPVGTLSDSS